MTYKQIKRTIENYDKEYQTAFMINGEHDSTENKVRMLERTKNKSNAAFTALFDAGILYDDNIAIEKEEVNMRILDFKNKNDIEREKLSQDATKKAKKKLEDLNDFEEVYVKMLDSIFELDKDELIKVINYAEEVRREKLRKADKQRNKEEREIVSKITCDINYNHSASISDRKSRENMIHHVGTPKEEIEAYINLITKEDVAFATLMSGVNDAIAAKESGLLINNLLVSIDFSKLPTWPEDRKRYVDDEAYNLGNNNFDLYKKTYESVYSLSKHSINKLKNKLEKDE